MANARNLMTLGEDGSQTGIAENAACVHKPKAMPARTEVYRYDRFNPLLLFADMRFGRASLAPGDLLPELTLFTAEGDERSLREVADGLPIALVTGSLSCPMTASAFSSLRKLEGRYGDRISFVLINVREAHPGNEIEQPKSFQNKLDHARMLRQTGGVSWPVLVDDLEGVLHQLLDAKPNSLHLFDAAGRVVFRSLFATDEAIQKALAAVAHGGSPEGASATQVLGPVLKAGGYIDEVLRAAGWRAYRDVLLAAPPMAILGLVSRAFPWLPKDRRGPVAAALLASITLLVLVGLAWVQ